MVAVRDALQQAVHELPLHVVDGGGQGPRAGAPTTGPSGRRNCHGGPPPARNPAPCRERPTPPRPRYRRPPQLRWASACASSGTATRPSPLRPPAGSAPS
eukprot:6324244-Pyramimonas_sp.AAC.1